MMLRFKVPRHQGKSTNNIEDKTFEVRTTIFFWRVKIAYKYIYCTKFYTMLVFGKNTTAVRLCFCVYEHLTKKDFAIKKTSRSRWIFHVGIVEIKCQDHRKKNTAMVEPVAATVPCLW